MKSLATTFRLGESTVRQIIYEACTAIFKKLSPNVMPVPTEADWKRKEKKNPNESLAYVFLRTY